MKCLKIICFVLFIIHLYACETSLDISQEYYKPCWNGNYQLSLYEDFTFDFTEKSTGCVSIVDSSGCVIMPASQRSSCVNGVFTLNDDILKLIPDTTFRPRQGILVSHHTFKVIEVEDITYLLRNHELGEADIELFNLIANSDLDMIRLSDFSTTLAHDHKRVRIDSVLPYLKSDFYKLIQNKFLLNVVAIYPDRIHEIPYKCVEVKLDKGSNIGIVKGMKLPLADDQYSILRSSGRLLGSCPQILISEVKEESCTALFPLQTYEKIGDPKYFTQFTTNRNKQKMISYK